MLRKFVGLGLMISMLLSTILCGNEAFAATLTMQKIYNYAAQGKTRELLAYIQYGYSVDIPDEDGNTALCYAIEQGNVVAVKRLISLGANRRSSCIQEFSDEELKKVGLMRKSYNQPGMYYKSKNASGVTPAVWKTKAALAVGVVGATAGIIALANHGGGGGGGSGSGNDPQKDEKTTLDEVTSIPAVNPSACTAAGGTWINGVCTTPVTAGADGMKAIATIDETNPEAPIYLAEFGGSLTNTKNAVYEGNNTQKVVAMRANGVNPAAYDSLNDTVQLSSAASIFNAKGGSLTLSESSENNKGVVGMYGTSAATVNNDGDISIYSLSGNDSAAIYVDRAGIANPGTGANITNNGKITLTDAGEGVGTVSGISAAGRNVTNNGTVEITLQNVSGSVDETKHGTAKGIYGKSAVNKGTISVKADTTTGQNLINTDVFLIDGSGDPDSTVANDGTLNIDLTGVAYGVHGVWSEPSVSATVKNTGAINVTGTLYNKTGDSMIGKQNYMMGVTGSSDSGTSLIRNSGTITVGTSKDAIDVSMGGILTAMYGFAGTMENESDVSFNIRANALEGNNAFDSYAMDLMYGTLTNSGNLTYLFTNLNEKGEKVNTNEVINITPVRVYTADGTNTGTISATMTGTAGTERTGSGSLVNSTFTAMTAINSGDLTNTGLINVDSTVDNMDLSGLIVGTGEARNSTTGNILLTTSGENSNLIGADATSSSGGGINEGHIYLKHNGGSADLIIGMNGANSGVVQIEANDMTGSTNIYGYGIGGISIGPDGDDSEEENDDVSSYEGTSGLVDITLKGTTSGNVVGSEYGAAASSASTIDFSGNVEINAKDKSRAGNLFIKGVSAATTHRNCDDDGIYETGTVVASNSGKIDINVAASSNPAQRTEVYGMYGRNAGVTNTGVVDIDVDLNNSSNHLIAGLRTEGTDFVETQAPFEYKALNTGTIDINVTGTGDNSVYSLDYPFDVVGILTNSYAMNTGKINLNVASSTAGTAGMVAYDGGVIVNRGDITFTGTADNFIPFYAVGSKTTKINTDEEKEEGEGEDKTRYIERVITKTNYFGTVYNSGTVTINGGKEYGVLGDLYVSDTFPEDSPAHGHAGEYYDVNAKDWLEITPDVPAISDWAREVWKSPTLKCDGDGKNCQVCEGENCRPFDENRDYTKKVDESTTQYFTKVSPIGLSLSSAAVQSADASAEGQLSGEIDNVMGSVNNALNENIASTQSTETTTPYTMQLNNGMKYVSEAGGSVIANGIHLLGDVTAGTTLVAGSNSDTYLGNGTGAGAIISDGDASGLTLSSDSAMFNATYAKNATNSKGLDIVMTRKNFDEIVENSSLASFLEKNYQAGNNVSFFDKLKAFSSLSGLTDSLNKLTGAGVLSRFNFEDMIMMRELNFSMNEQLFHNKDNSFAVAGTVAPMAFKGDTGSASKYSLFNKRNGNMSVGLGIAYSDIKSDDEHKDNRRHETMYQMIVPIGFKLMGFNLMTSPRVGYARGNYDRQGFDNMSYDGTVEKRVYGLMNEARYPIDLGDWVMEPAVEFNVLGYTQKGHENNKDYSLNIKSQNTYSIESGIGLYFTKDKQIGKDGHLKLSAGAALYHEFADPYKLNIGMQGMTGTFRLRDENRSENRGVLRLGLDYENKDYTIYGSLISFMDKEVRTNFKSGVKLKF